ncbi:MAG: malto-oligosyltrehalose trehalohydrolase [Actinomycetota bacterium]|nr:malto-oligosyltrehalose trehalohydrolase [Actinomycetota bacterium]
MPFSVWAPRAHGSVEILVGSERIALLRRERGRWSADVPALVPGVDYALAIDGGPPRPDPRSAHQPAGVDGPSRWVDHGSFRWSDAAWGGIELSRSVLYELHVGTFSAAGTFSGVIERLDHLVELGVDAIELMPVVEFSGARGWGYDCVDLWAPHSAYGGPDGLKELVDACHAKGLGIVLDVVYNHLGPAGNFLADFGPYFDDRHHTNWGQGINVDGPGSDEVREFIVDNALMWLRDYHVDGLRLDAVHAIVDESALHILEQLSGAVSALSAVRGVPLWLIAESDLNDPRFVRSPSAGGYGLAASWADEWHHALHAVLTGETSGYYSDFGSIAQLVKALRQAWVYDGAYSVHRDRVHGRPPLGLSGDQFVVCTQNHDQIGNRAAGERLGMLTSVGRMKIAAALLLTGPFVPLLFQGEEWAASTPFQYFTDHQDPELGRAVSEGRRKEFAYFGWQPEDVPDPQDAATFERSRLRWDELGSPGHAGMLDWYRSLIALRRKHAHLGCGPLDDVKVDYDVEHQCLVVQRRAAAISVAVNLGPGPRELQLGQKILLSSVPDLEIGGNGVVVLPADSVVIVDSSRGQID